jgi:tetratricopeptide (TPR) repeat protein
MKQFAGALKLNPAVPGLHSWYGQALLATGDPEAASQAFREELQQNPNDFDSNLRLGQILLQRKASDEALPLLDKAAAERPQSFEAHMSFARAELQKRDYDRAIPLLTGIIARWPDAAGPHAALADAYASTGRTNDAFKERQLSAKLAGPLNLGANEDNDGPKPGDLAPGFSLPGLHGAGNISLDRTRQASKAAVLVFGSYTCPNFRAQAAALNTLADSYQKQIPFLLVYIQEAHTGETWESTINQREGINWKPAKTNSEMQDHATSCVRKLKVNFPAVVDGIEGKVEAAYAAWPSRLYVIGRNGRVVYRTRLSELDFRPADVEAAIRKAELQ